ncbi:MAG: putative toxin-antitoxin system toxin component, PIN family [Nitrospirae bacterium]|nr:putative toxin-antitoxin system toxin component, PIN family [Nitrospirota bacterium]
MRVVFDTNIYISAFVIPNSRAALAVEKILERDDTLFISKPVIDEVLTVLASKFGGDAEALSRTAVYIADIARVVRPTAAVNILLDEPDNRILECAEAGNADLIVTGDKKMLELGRFNNTEIITLKAYLDG